MRFWDSSAITPLLVAEPASHAIAEMLADDERIVAWWGSRVECVSALRRRERQGALSAVDLRRSIDLLDALSASWTEILPSQQLRSRAERSLALHDLRAADALQLAAAITWTEGEPSGSAFTCLDSRLREAASREGFELLPLEPSDTS